MVAVDMALGAEIGSLHGLLGEVFVVVGSGSVLVTEEGKTPFAEVASSFLI